MFNNSARLSKKTIKDSLPITGPGYTIRWWKRLDLDLISRWRSYQFPYRSFDLSFKNGTTEEKNEYYNQREDNENRISLTVDFPLCQYR